MDARKDIRCPFGSVSFRFFFPSVNERGFSIRRENV